MDFKGLYDIRDFEPGDLNFILSSFLKGLYNGDSWYSLIPEKIFMSNYRHIAKALINKSNVKVAVLPDDPSIIIGYSILSRDYQTIHWVYVKAAWRKKGIGKSLLPRHPLYVSHLNVLGKSLLSKFPHTVFNPFSI